MGRPRLSYHLKAELEDDYRAGRSGSWTAVRRGVADVTAQSYFDRFRREGIPRGKRWRKPHVKHLRDAPPAPYTGPTWIG